MALENIYNVPEVCSGMLRIAPRALQILNFQPPPPLLTFILNASGVSLALCPTWPPLGKNPGSAPELYEKELLHDILGLSIQK